MIKNYIKKTASILLILLFHSFAFSQSECMELVNDSRFPLNQMDGRRGYDLKLQLIEESLHPSMAFDYVQAQIFKIGEETGKSGADLFKEILKREDIDITGDKLQAISITTGSLREGGVEINLEILKRENLPDNVLLTIIDMAKFFTEGKRILLKVLERKDMPHYILQIIENAAGELREGAEEVKYAAAMNI